MPCGCIIFAVGLVVAMVFGALAAVYDGAPVFAIPALIGFGVVVLGSIVGWIELKTSQ